MPQTPVPKGRGTALGLIDSRSIATSAACGAALDSGILAGVVQKHREEVTVSGHVTRQSHWNSVGIFVNSVRVESCALRTPGPIAQKDLIEATI